MKWIDKICSLDNFTSICFSCRPDLSLMLCLHFDFSQFTCEACELQHETLTPIQHVGHRRDSAYENPKK